MYTWQYAQIWGHITPSAGGQAVRKEKIMERTKMINEIIENQNRANDHIFTKEKLEKLNFEMLSLVHEASKHLRIK